MKHAFDFCPNRMGKAVHIAIVDSGVHAEHPHVAGVAGGIFIRADGALSDDYVDRLKIFSDSLAVPIEALIRAIDWAAEAGARLINLSLGTSRAKHEAVLLEAVERARERKAILVAACEDSGVRWLPGSLPGVLPVRLDWSLSRHEYHVEQDERVVFRASGYPRPIPGVPAERNLRGISFAVANMTGFCARALEAYPEADLDELIDLLAERKPTEG
ncbi:MAG: hypothetical protein DMG09_02495 [Acidobacteria bacterium]|nr:MAG: hypothetical protein DMG09_02495 [Acidobacteriota bacterium]